MRERGGRSKPLAWRVAQCVGEQGVVGLQTAGVTHIKFLNAIAALDVRRWRCAEVLFSVAALPRSRHASRQGRRECGEENFGCTFVFSFERSDQPNNHYLYGVH